MTDLSGRHVLIMATNRFEESELFGPREMLIARGAKVSLASLDRKPIQATVHDELGKTIEPDMSLGEVDPDEYDALLLPGGVGNPDRLRMDPEAVAIVREFDAAKKPVAAICHGPWMLAEADIVRGRTVTSWPSIRTDLKNAGANGVDEEAVTDGNLVTSRKPDDVPAFTDALTELLKG